MGVCSKCIQEGHILSGEHQDTEWLCHVPGSLTEPGTMFEGAWVVALFPCQAAKKSNFFSELERTPVAEHLLSTYNILGSILNTMGRKQDSSTTNSRKEPKDELQNIYTEHTFRNKLMPE